MSYILDYQFTLMILCLAYWSKEWPRWEVRDKETFFFKRENLFSFEGLEIELIGPWKVRSEKRRKQSVLESLVIFDYEYPVGATYSNAKILITLAIAPNLVFVLQIFFHSLVISSSPLQVLFPSSSRSSFRPSSSSTSAHTARTCTTKFAGAYCHHQGDW